MATTPPKLPDDTVSHALRIAKEQAAANIVLPPPLPRHAPPQLKQTTPPSLPSWTYSTIQESAKAAEEKLRSKRASLLLDQAELERFKNLIVFAKTAVESRQQGRHKSPDLGGGGEFSEYVNYEPGKPISAIDWHVFARTRKLVIRRYQQETDMDVHLLVDVSGSMAYQRENREAKGHHAARIAAALAYLMIKQGDKASLTLFTDRIIEHLPAAGTRRHLMSMLRSLVKPAYESSGQTDLPAALKEYKRLMRRRGRLVILSDFLGHDPKTVFESLSPFIHARFEILLMQLTDPDELTLPNAPLACFVDMETDESIEVEPEEIRADYEILVRGKMNEFANGGARHKIDFTSLNTANPYREAIEAYLGFRKKRI